MSIYGAVPPVTADCFGRSLRRRYQVWVVPVPPAIFLFLFTVLTIATQILWTASGFQDIWTALRTFKPVLLSPLVSHHAAALGVASTTRSGRGGLIAFEHGFFDVDTQRQSTAREKVNRPTDGQKLYPPFVRFLAGVIIVGLPALSVPGETLGLINSSVS